MELLTELAGKTRLEFWRRIRDKQAVYLIARSVADFFRYHRQMLAAAISCFFVLTFIPFFVFLVSIMTRIIAGREDFKYFLLHWITSFFPAITSDVSNELISLVDNSQVGLVTLVAYLFFSYHLYTAIELAFNQIFKMPGRRKILHSAINSLLIITLFMAMVIVVFGVGIILSFVLNLGEVLDLPKFDTIIHIAGFLVPPFLMFLTVTALYRYIPRKRIFLKNAVKGAVFTAVFVEAAKYVFTFYIAFKLGQFGKFYGSLTGVVIFIMWLLYSISIFLIGADIVNNLESRSHRPG